VFNITVSGCQSAAYTHAPVIVTHRLFRLVRPSNRMMLNPVSRLLFRPLLKSIHRQCCADSDQYTHSQLLQTSQPIEQLAAHFCQLVAAQEPGAVNPSLAARAVLQRYLARLQSLQAGQSSKQPGAQSCQVVAGQAPVAVSTHACSVSSAQCPEQTTSLSLTGTADLSVPRKVQGSLPSAGCRSYS
jgi:hypothetical protein